MLECIVQQYDIVICGAGLSGRILAYYLVRYGKTTSILLIDSNFQGKEAIIAYWEKVPGEFDHLTIASHNTITTTLSSGKIQQHRLTQHLYKYIYKSSLYKYIDSVILPTCKKLTSRVIDIRDEDDYALITTTNGKIRAKKVYSSIPATVHVLKNTQYFTGIEFDTDKPIENPLFMDFSFFEQNVLGFGYALPINSSRIFVHLVRYDRLPTQNECMAYSQKLIKGQAHISIRRLEQGKTDLFITPNRKSKPHIEYIGKRGGYINPATGFGFTHFCEYAKAIVNLPTVTMSTHHVHLYLLLIAAIQFAPRIARKIFEKTVSLNNFDQVLDFISGRGGIRQCAKIAMHIARDRIG